MNLKRIAEWMGYEGLLESAFALHRQNGKRTETFDPLNDWRDCGPVQTKLIIEGLIQIRSNYRIAYYSFKARKDMRSQTIVTDDATLRRAIVELAGQVAEGGK